MHANARRSSSRQRLTFSLLASFRSCSLRRVGPGLEIRMRSQRCALDLFRGRIRIPRPEARIAEHQRAVLDRAVADHLAVASEVLRVDPGLAVALLGEA